MNRVMMLTESDRLENISSHTSIKVCRERKSRGRTAVYLLLYKSGASPPRLPAISRFSLLVGISPSPARLLSSAAFVGLHLDPLHSSTPLPDILYIPPLLRDLLRASPNSARPRFPHGVLRFFLRLSPVARCVAPHVSHVSMAGFIRLLP